MPRFNRVFEELGIEYNDYVIPPDVLLGLEKKKDSSKAVAAAESKKRKGGGSVKALAKKRKAEVPLEAPVGSSSARSSAAESNSVDFAPLEVAKAAPAAGAQVSRAVSSVRAPFASLLREESSDAEAPRASPARVVSPAREASAGGGSPPKERQGESSDEAESASVRRIKRTEDLSRPVGDGINSLYMGKDFSLVDSGISAYFDCLGLIFLYIFQRMLLWGWLPWRSWLKAPASRRKALLFLRVVILRPLRWPAGLRPLMCLVLVSFFFFVYFSEFVFCGLC